MTLKQKSFTRKVLIYIALIIMAVAALFPILFCLSASLRTQVSEHVSVLDQIPDTHCRYSRELCDHFYKT